MPARSKRSATSAVSSSVPPRTYRYISEDVARPYIRADVVDVSESSEFYKRKAAVAGELMDYVEPLSGSRYRLKNDFLAWFLDSLALVQGSHLVKPVDALADSLHRLALHWAENSNRRPYDLSRFSQERLSEEWKQSWGRLTEEHWESFRRIGAPLETFILTAIGNDGTLDPAEWSVPTRHHVELGISFEQDVQRLPEMRIIVRGDPAISFMIAYIRNSERRPWPKKEKREREDARLLLDSIMQAFKKDFLGLTRSKKGRPRESGERAAYLLYHERKGIRWVSREVCASSEGPNHTCDRRCFDNTKKSAENYYKHLRRELRSLVQSSQKKSSE